MSTKHTHAQQSGAKRQNEPRHGRKMEIRNREVLQVWPSLKLFFSFHLSRASSQTSTFYVVFVLRLGRSFGFFFFSLFPFTLYDLFDEFSFSSFVEDWSRYNGRDFLFAVSSLVCSCVCVWAVARWRRTSIVLLPLILYRIHTIGRPLIRPSRNIDWFRKW